MPKYFRKRCGFTLVELLVVIGIIGLLISILLPALSTAREQAQKIKCMAQMKQLGLAFVIYATDNKGWLASCDTCGPLTPVGYIDAAGVQLFPTPAATTTWVGWVDGGPTAASITNGTLYPYIKNAALYHCPSDINQYRVRSYSMNEFISTGETKPLTDAYKVYKMTQVTDSSRALLFNEEPDPRGGSNYAALDSQWNVNGWWQNPASADSWDNAKDLWGDTVATWHRGGANFVFVDGHAEYWRFTDKRTLSPYNGNPSWPSNTAQPNNADLLRIRNQIVTWPQQRAAV